MPRSWDLDEPAVTALAAKHLGRLASDVRVELAQVSARHDRADVTAWLRRSVSPTVAELWRAGTGLAALLEAGPLDADGAWALLGAGRGDLLVRTSAARRHPELDRQTFVQVSGLRGAEKRKSCRHTTPRVPLDMAPVLAVYWSATFDWCAAADPT